MIESLVVFGGGGFIGGHLSSMALRRGASVHIAATTVRDAVPHATWHHVDVTRENDAQALLEQIRPTHVVNLAAISNIDLAEQSPAVARAVNVAGARRVAQACTRVDARLLPEPTEEGIAWRVDARLLHFSSDAVFSGRQAEYCESDPREPVNVYGCSKRDGEDSVLDAAPQTSIVRISLALGFPVTNVTSFLASLHEKLREGAPVIAPRDEIRTPLDVNTICECVLELLELDHAGPINLASSDAWDRASITRRAADLMGYPRARVNDSPIDDPGRAPRHRSGVLSVELARSMLKTPLPDVGQALERAMSGRRSS